MSHDSHSSDAGHEHSIKPYIMVFFALMIGTFLTVWVADFGHKHHFSRELGAALALLIAVCKASLVVWFFMHVRENAKIVQVTAIGGFLWLTLLFIFTFGDFMSRSHVDVGLSWDKGVQSSTAVDSGSSRHQIDSIPDAAPAADESHAGQPEKPAAAPAPAH